MATYDEYKKRLETLAHIKDTIIKYRILIISCVVAIMTLISILLGINGMILDTVVGKTELTYGETLEFSTKSVFNKATVEYKAKDGNSWEEGLPNEPGVYEVRTVTQRSFGVTEHGEIKEVKIKKKDIIITIENDTIVYGDELKISGDLSFEDKIVCTDFDFNVMYDGYAEVSPNADNLKIINKNGEDVTDAYNIYFDTKGIQYTKRDIRIETESITREYDGTVKLYDDYRITEGKIGYSDDLQVIMRSPFGTLAGTYSNEADLTIFDTKGHDVTNVFYNVNLSFGYVQIKKIDLYVHTQTMTRQYNGEPLIAKQVALTREQDLYFSEEIRVYSMADANLPEGESFVIANYPAPVDVGTYVNNVEIEPGPNTNIDNYNLHYEYGNLFIFAAPIIIKTHSIRAVFDGETKSAGYEVIGTLYRNAEVYANSMSAYMTPGDYDNYGSFTIYEEGMVSYNYEIIYDWGKIVIDKVQLKVTTGSAEKEYDGTPLTCSTRSQIPLNCDSYPTAYLTYDPLASQTAVGSITNAASLSDFSSMYFEIKETDYGTLTVNRRYLLLSISNLTVQYDANSHSPIITDVLSKKLDGDYYNLEDYSAKEVKGDEETYHFDMTNLSLSNSSGRCNYYQIEFEGDSYKDGQLTITRAPYTLSLYNTFATYDAGYHAPDYVASGVFSPDVVVAVYYDVYQKIVGTCTSTVVSALISGNGKDVTNCYSLQNYPSATITVNPRPITVDARKVEIVYDGYAHYPNTWIVVHGSLIEGDSIAVDTYVGYAQKNVGLYSTLISAAHVVDADGEISENNPYYTISYGTEGSIKILPRPITVAPETIVAEYDGYIHRPQVVDVIDGSIADNEEIVAPVLNGERTEIGETETSIESFEICDADSIFTTSNYEITYATSSVRVVARMITISTASAQKKYDGTPLTAPTYELIYNEELHGSNPFLGSDYIDVTVIGTITEVGVVPNYAYYTLHGDSLYYDIRLTCGILAVYKDNPTEQTDPPTGNALDESGGFSKGGAAGKNTVLCMVTADTTGPLYLKSHSYDVYQGNRWAKETTDTQINGEYSPDYLLGTALANKGLNVHNATIVSYVDSPLLPYYQSTTFSYISGEDLKASEKNGYTLSYYAASNTFIQGAASGLSLGSYASAESYYRNYVYHTYLQSNGGALDAYLQQIIEENNFTKTDSGIIQKVAYYIQNAAKYNLDFDEQLNNEDDVVLAFLRDYKEGICQHYASAATMLYRALGIPARRVDGIVCIINEAGVPQKIMSNSAHAWVEVYVDGLGWVQVEVTGSGEAFGEGDGSGSSSSSKQTTPQSYETINDYFSNREIHIKPITTAKKITSVDEELTPIQQVETTTGHALLEILLQRGFTYTCEIAGSQIGLGVGESTITSFTLFNKDGLDVTNKYILYYEPGEIVLTEKEIITITWSTFIGVYAGYTKYSNIYTAEHPSDVTVSMNTNVAYTEAGAVESDSLDGVITVRKNNLGVTNDYFILHRKSPIVLNPASIVVATNSVTKEVSDSAAYLECVITQGWLMDGHEMRVELAGVPNIPGTYDNKIAKLVIVDTYNNDVDVTKYYEIEVIEGIIEIKKEANDRSNN